LGLDIVASSPRVLSNKRIEQMAQGRLLKGGAWPLLMRYTLGGRRNVRRLASVLVLVAAFVLVVSGCGSRAAPDSELSNAITKQAEAGAGTVIDFVALTDFQWERLYIFDPYTTVDEIHRALGFRWNAAASTGIDKLDGIALLVFVEGDEVVRYVEHPRNRGDFVPLARPEPWSTTDKFVIVQVDDLGQPWLEVRQAAP